MCGSRIGCICVALGQDVYVWLQDRMYMCGSRIGCICVLRGQDVYVCLEDICVHRGQDIYVCIEDSMYICASGIGCICGALGYDIDVCHQDRIYMCATYLQNATILKCRRQCTTASNKQQFKNNCSGSQQGQFLIQLHNLPLLLTAIKTSQGHLFNFMMYCFKTSSCHEYD